MNTRYLVVWIPSWLAWGLVVLVVCAIVYLVLTRYMGR